MIESRFCLDCNETLKGRSDKKFCDDQCRSNYNNRQYSENTAYMRRINSILKRNRRIMEELNPEGKAKSTRKKLLARGFSFEYFTNTYQTQTGNTYFFCYEAGYLLLANDEVLIVRKDEGKK